MVHDLNIMSWPRVPLLGMYARIILQGHVMSFRILGVTPSASHCVGVLLTM